MAGGSAAPWQERGEITFSTAFEGAAVGRIEKLGDTTFRVHVLGQQDERGRNRAATWYCFRMDNVRDRELTVTLTDFVGEYNDRPGACPMNEHLRPSYSEDGLHWQHIQDMQWDDEAKEATIRHRPAGDSLWLATQPPYTHGRLVAFLDEVQRSPHARVEVIGKSSQGRDLHLVTVTNHARPDDDKVTVWLQARQHAWEAGTSYVLEGALRFSIADTPEAQALRDHAICIFTPMIGVDGAALGLPRFNVHGFDPNRHWNEVDLRDKKYLTKMPEIWYPKKALVHHRATGGRVDLMINMHNTETAEYLETQATDEQSLARMHALFDRLVAGTTFDPLTPTLRVAKQPAGNTNWMYQEAGIPVMLMEQRIGFSTKLNRWPLVSDRLEFGPALLSAMVSAAQLVRE